MRRGRNRALLALLLTGAWLPLTLTCDPRGTDLLIHVDDYWYDGVIIEDGCRRCGHDDWWDGFYFDLDFEYDD